MVGTELRVLDQSRWAWQYPHSECCSCCAVLCYAVACCAVASGEMLHCLKSFAGGVHQRDSLMETAFKGIGSLPGAKVAKLQAAEAQKVKHSLHGIYVSFWPLFGQHQRCMKLRLLVVPTVCMCLAWRVRVKHVSMAVLRGIWALVRARLQPYMAYCAASTYCSSVAVCAYVHAAGCCHAVSA